METQVNVLAVPGVTTPAPGTAIITEADVASGHCTVTTSSRALRAVRAPSCLVQPRSGDTVTYVEAGETTYITSVLKRQDDAPLTLDLPPGTVIHCDGGTLELRADVLALRSRALSVEGEQAHLSVDQVVGVGQRASWSFGAVKFTAELLESFAERVLQFSRWSQRMIDGPDQVRSRQMDYRAEQVMQLQAQTMIATADKLFKADSDQIHLG